MRALARLGSVWGVVFFLVAGGAQAGSAPVAAPRLRIKNGHHMNVSLGKSRQDAIGVRPDKKSWQLELGAELIGADAEFEDVTPNARGGRWTLPVASAKVELDSERFLPSHVYRLDIRRARVLVGTTLVYLYPPPAERVRRVDLDDRPEGADHADDAGGPGVVPKSGL
jgi:uncharacterized protein (DUF779 family)